MRKWTVSVKHLTDDAIAKAFEGTNFGRTDFRAILAETVIQIAAGYECGFTATAIALKLGLLTPVRTQPSRTGYEFVYDFYCRRNRNEHQ